MTGEISLKSINLLDNDGNECDQVICGHPLTIQGIFNSNVKIENAEIVYGIHTTDMVYIASMGTAHLEKQATVQIGCNIINCKIQNLPLIPGTYAIRIGVLDKNRRPMFYGETLKMFIVQPRDIPISKMAVLGLVDIPSTWDFSLTSP